MLDGRCSSSRLPTYDPWAIGTENVYAHGKRLRFIIDAIDAYRTERNKAPSELTILDIGCGTGIMITLPLGSLGYRVTGVDIDEESVKAAQRVNPYPHVRFRHGGLSECGAIEPRYDVVVASEVLEHLPDPLAFLRTLRAHLAQDGMLILTTPNGYGWFEWEAFLWERVGVGTLILGWERIRTAWLKRLKAPIKRLIGWRPPVGPSAPWSHLTSTKNAASPHLQHFHWGRLQHLIALTGLAITGTGKGSVFCGEITAYCFRGNRLFTFLNARLADLLPRIFAANWYLTCRPSLVNPEILCIADSGLAARAEADLADIGGARLRVVSFRQLRREPFLALRLLSRHVDIVFGYVADVEGPLYRDFVLAYLFLFRAGRKAIRDARGREMPIRTRDGLQALLRCAADVAGLPLGYGQACFKARRLSRARRGPYPRQFSRLRLAYLRTNPWQESTAGGSLAHTAGVLGGFVDAGWEVSFVSTHAFAPAQRLGLPTHLVPPRIGWLRNVLPFLAYSRLFARRCHAVFDSPPAFVYQRYSVMNASGAEVATRFRCPFILEYNGSEVWVARHWSTPLLFERLALQIEEANLQRADLIVVVSKILGEELVARGVSAKRVLVNPNGVDPVLYHPGIDGKPVRQQLGIDGRLVIGFVGTFGPWHGAEVLARAIRPVVERLPQAHFLFVGDGSRMAAVREIVVREGVESCVTFTGLVPQDEAPAYLAACDILVSPHVPNADGSRFFGSPTKLFEYMAMGQGIVASDLEQIGEVLTHDRTAWLVRPGDVEDLVAGIVALGSDPEMRIRLGAAARAEAVERYTWDAHIRRMLGRMEELGLLLPQGNLS